MLSHRLQDANNQMERLNTTAQRVGLKIHPGKTKVMRINAIINKETEVRLDQSYIEEVEEFTFLGSAMNKTGGTDEDIAARRKKAQQAFAMITPVWRSKDLRTAPTPMLRQFTVQFRDMASDDSFYKASRNIRQQVSEENSESILA